MPATYMQATTSRFLPLSRRDSALARRVEQGTCIRGGVALRATLTDDLPETPLANTNDCRGETALWDVKLTAGRLLFRAWIGRWQASGNAIEKLVQFETDALGRHGGHRPRMGFDFQRRTTWRLNL